MQEEELNTTSPNEFENKANKNYNNSDLVVEEEVLGHSLVKLPEDVNTSHITLVLLNYLIPHPPCLMSRTSKV